MKTKATDKADGKQTNQLRALKDGMEIVITAAGERPENYERFEAWAWDYWQPDDVTEETWTDDFVANWWQRERARRCRSAAIWNSLQNLGINRVYMSSDEVEALKIRFQLSFERYRTRTSSTTSGDLDKIVTELGSVRSQLASTSGGPPVLDREIEVDQGRSGADGANVACIGICLVRIRWPYE